VAEESRDKHTAKEAVALKYEPTKDHAPRVRAKGRGLLAERIIEIARAHGIPIKEEPDLVRVLSKLDIDQEIPPPLYRAVAEIFAFVYSLNRDFPKTSQSIR